MGINGSVLLITVIFGAARLIVAAFAVRPLMPQLVNRYRNARPCYVRLSLDSDCVADIADGPVRAINGRSGSRSRRLRTGCQSGRGGALTANRAAEPVSHTDLLYRLAGVKLPTPGPVFSLQALTHLRHCAFLVLFVRRVRSRRM